MNHPPDGVLNPSPSDAGKPAELSLQRRKLAELLMWAEAHATCGPFDIPTPNWEKYRDDLDSRPVLVGVYYY